MKKKKVRSLFLSFILVVALVAIQTSVAMSVELNDNVNIAGELFLDGNDCGVTYHDGTRQTTASLPPWCQILPAAQRFVLVMNNEAVLDRETGLVWERYTSDTKQDWVYATLVCRWATIGGRNGWRLPTVDELATLVDGTADGVKLPAGHPFLNAKAARYWSSTTLVGYQPSNTDTAWYVGFSSFCGSSYSSKTEEYYVRAVRASQ